MLSQIELVQQEKLVQQEELVQEKLVQQEEFVQEKLRDLEFISQELTNGDCPGNDPLDPQKMNGRDTQVDHFTPVLCDPWTEHIVEHCMQIRSKSLSKMKEHEQHSTKYRRRSHVLSIPALIIPTVMAPVSLLVNSDDDPCADSQVSTYEYLTTIGFIFTGVFQALSKHYQYDIRAHHHNMFASRYQSLASEIDEELIKRKEYRDNADAFMASIRLKFNNYVEQEPYL